MRGSSGARGGRLRAFLIVGEVALSVVLLVGSSLLLISFLSLQRTPPGFDPTGVATAFVGVPVGKFATPPEQADVLRGASSSELRRNPQITHASASLGAAGGGIRRALAVQRGRPADPAAAAAAAGRPATS